MTKYKKQFVFWLIVFWVTCPVIPACLLLTYIWNPEFRKWADNIFGIVHKKE